jgi:hypothetical protein
MLHRVSRVGRSAAFTKRTTQQQIIVLASHNSQVRTKFDNSLNATLEQIDPEMYDIIEHEKRRQYRGLQLIPSEVRCIYRKCEECIYSHHRFNRTSPVMQYYKHWVQ